MRWHFHPEYELHHVVATSGRYFVGDYIGEVDPGNLLLTGPNLPHNWVSDVPEGAIVPLRGRVVQFTEGFMAQASEVFPELSACAGVLDLSRRGEVLLARPIRFHVSGHQQAACLHRRRSDGTLH